MTVEVKAEAAAAAAGVEKEEPKARMVEKSSSYREESNCLSDLREYERKALNDLKAKLEEAILGNTLFRKEDEKKPNEEEKEKEKEKEKDCVKEGEDEKKAECGDDKKPEEENQNKGSEEEPETAKEEESEQPKAKPEPEIDRDVSIWGVPLLPTKGNESTNIVLLKFLRAREFKVNEALEMLKKTLEWRKEFKIDTILEEEFETDLSSAAYMCGVDRQSHTVCYNIFGVLDNEEIYDKTLGTEEKREQFLRWRVQLMERGVEKLDFKPDGVNSLVQVNDLKNSPGPARKEVRTAVNKAVALLQDNYPEFVAKNIFINVPFWYFAYHSLVSPFLTQRTRSKLVFARPSKVTDTLLKYIPIQEIPIQYGGMKRENDSEFFPISDGEPTEVMIKAGSTHTIEIPTPEAGTTFIWDVIVLGWEVNYTEEFVPTDESSYTMMIQKGKRICSDELPVRKTFKNHEPGKIVITVQNTSGKKKKMFYRHKVKKACF
ncbi:patellin-4 [Andrographis paniculata]|uniref:patellin-4 n=1 Tax=Andrographis paniculata TaxID=175694 RepID=UPI0021E70388|nr:patellin-4 [Andrographis paniculata]